MKKQKDNDKLCHELVRWKRQNDQLSAQLEEERRAARSAAAELAGLRPQLASREAVSAA